MSSAHIESLQQQFARPTVTVTDLASQRTVVKRQLHRFTRQLSGCLSEKHLEFDGVEQSTPLIAYLRARLDHSGGVRL